jgi:hypothetical protein
MTGILRTTILVLTTTLLPDVVDFFPKEANDWKAKEEGRWRFLKGFSKSRRARTGEEEGGKGSLTVSQLGARKRFARS